MKKFRVYVDSSSTGNDAEGISGSCTIVCEKDYTVAQLFARQRHVWMPAFDLEMWGMIETIRWIAKQDSDHVYTLINDSDGCINCLKKLLKSSPKSNYRLPFRHSSLHPTQREILVWKDMYQVGMLHLMHQHREHRVLRLADRCASWARTARSDSQAKWVARFGSIIGTHKLKWASEDAMEQSINQVRCISMEIGTVKQRALERLELNDDPITFDQLVNSIIERQIAVAFSTDLG